VSFVAIQEQLVEAGRSKPGYNTEAILISSDFSPLKQHITSCQNFPATAVDVLRLSTLRYNEHPRPVHMGVQHAQGLFPLVYDIP